MWFELRRKNFLWRISFRPCAPFSCHLRQLPPHEPISYQCAHKKCACMEHDTLKSALSCPGCRHEKLGSLDRLLEISLLSVVRRLITTMCYLVAGRITTQHPTSVDFIYQVRSIRHISRHLLDQASRISSSNMVRRNVFRNHRPCATDAAVTNGHAGSVSQC